MFTTGLTRRERRASTQNYRIDIECGAGEITSALMRLTPDEIAVIDRLVEIINWEADEYSPTMRVERRPDALHDRHRRQIEAGER